MEMSIWKPYIAGTKIHALYYNTHIGLAFLNFLKFFCEKLAKYSIISVMLYMVCKTIQKFQNVSISI